jgi:uncharacterized protein
VTPHRAILKHMVERQRPPSQAFLQECVERLRRDQALDNLPLVLLDRALHHQEFREKLYVVVVRAKGEVQALAWRGDFPKMGLASATNHDAIVSLAVQVRQDMPDLPCILGPKDEVRRFVQAWLRPGEPMPKLGMPQLIYRLVRVTPHPPVAGALRSADESDVPLLVVWFSRFIEDVGDAVRQSPQQLEEDIRRRMSQDGLFVWEDQEPVSMVGAAGPPGLVARVGPVYTPPDRRRRGYAGAATAAVSQVMLDRGHPVCCLYTDASNPTSNHIYQEVGYELVSEVEEYWFRPPAARSEFRN